jgi:hypothetical protein
VSTQPEALSLADYLDLPHVGQHRSAAELRRLHSVNAELLEALKSLMHEVDESGNGYAKDFGWPVAVGKARAAVAKAEGVKP